jgi:putative transcriptional regulator
MPTWHTGRLLVAMPVLDDPAFARAVVLLIDHDEDGALGVVLNRASEVPVSEATDTLIDLIPAPGVLFGGGPVEPDALVAIGRAHDGAARSETTFVEGLRLVDLDQDPVLAGVELTQVRLFAGYAGWAPGQLEHEVWHGAWAVVDSEPSDVFTSRPETLWHDVLARQPGRLRLLAGFPNDVALN